MIALYIAVGILAIGLIIFIHEAGHFLAAKKVGVRVERFALGFDPPIRGRNLRFFSKQWGETEYVIGMVPFGGYVKLAGEMIPEDGKDPKPDELLAQSIGARALVFAAGALMNFLSAFVFFMIAFTFGVEFTAPVLGPITPGTPVWKAGLRPDDHVIELNGDSVVDLNEIMVEGALGGADSTLHFRVEREGVAEPLEFKVQPEYNAAMGFSTIGLGRQGSWDPVLEDVPPDSAAAAAGLRTGDRVVGASLGGYELPELTPTLLVSALNAYVALHPTEPFRLQVARSDASSSQEEELWIDLASSGPDPDAKPRAQFRVLAGTGTIARHLAPGSDAADVLQQHDEILRVNDETVACMSWSDLARRFTTDTLRLAVRGREGGDRDVEVARHRLLGWLLRREIDWAYRPLVVGEITAGSPLEKAGLKLGDVLRDVAGVPVYGEDDLVTTLGGEKGGASVKVVVLHPAPDGKGLAASPTELDVPRDALQAGDGVRWRSFPPLQSIDPAGPAGKAGMEVGSRVVKLNSEPVYGWEEFREHVTSRKPGDKVAVEWLDAAGELHQSEVVVSYTPPKTIELPIDGRKRLVQSGVLDSFVLGLERSVFVGKQVFTTLRSLIRRDVSPKNLAGPVGITHLLYRVAELGWTRLLYWMAIISVNLGLLNLMPFPILDGGHLLFLAIEKAKGSPVSIRIQERVTTVAFLLIITLAVFVTYHDIARFF